MTGLLAIALSLLLFGYLLTKPPGQFSDTPPRIGLVLSGACEGELAVYSTLDRNRDIVLAVSIKASEPGDYSRTFKNLAEQLETSVPYAPLGDEVNCDRMQLALVGPPNSAIEPKGAVFGGVIVQNQTVGSYRRSGVIETALSEDDNATAPATDPTSGPIRRNPDAVRRNVGFISTIDNPNIIQNADLSDVDDIGRRGSVLGTADRDFGSILADCIGPHNLTEAEIDLSLHSCAAFVKAEAFPEFVNVASPTMSCVQPGGPETRQCIGKSSLMTKRLAPVALLFKIDCPECKRGQKLGFTVEAIFTQMSTWISGSDTTVSLTAVSTKRKVPTPWSDDDATRKKRFDDWISTADVGAYATTLDSYVWEPKNLNEQRQFNLMWGAIVLGLGMTILIELLIVSIHPGIRLQTTPHKEDDD